MAAAVAAAIVTATVAPTAVAAIVIAALVIAIVTLVALMRARLDAVALMVGLVIFGDGVVAAIAGGGALVVVILGRGSRHLAAMVRARQGWLRGKDAEQADRGYRQQGTVLHLVAPIRRKGADCLCASFAPPDYGALKCVIAILAVAYFIPPTWA